MKYATAVSVTLVRPDGQACTNAMVCWGSADAVALIRSTWRQFRAQGGPMVFTPPQPEPQDGEGPDNG